MARTLVEQGQRPDHRPQVERVEGQDLVYPDVGTCITVTFCRPGPPAPYLVGVHLGMFEHDDSYIQQATVASAMKQMKALLDTRKVLLTKRRPYVTFIIGWIENWRQGVANRWAEVDNYVTAWQRRGGTQIIRFDLADLNPPPNTATITFRTNYTISIVGEHSTRDAKTHVVTRTPVNHPGVWNPPVAATL